MNKKVYNEIWELGGNSEYHYADWNVNILSGKHISIDINKIPGIKIRTFMIHFHNVLYPLNPDENGDYKETVKVPEHYFNGRLRFS